MDFTRLCEVWFYLFTVLREHRNKKTFCEIGCGSSILLTELSESVGEVVGIDYSQKALERSRNLFQRLKIRNFRLLEDDIRRLKSKGKFDVVFSNGLLEHFEDPGKIILNHLEITKDGGHTIIAVPHKYSFKNVWYLLTRPKPLRRYWPWTEQMFFTKKGIEHCCKKHCPNYNHKVKVSYLTANVILTVHKNVL